MGVQGSEQQSGRGVSIAIVGATGAVGETLFRVLEERRFPAREVHALASGRSAGRKLAFGGRELSVREATPEAFDGVDIVFFAATGSLSATLAPEAVKRGAIVIDKSSTWRMNDDVPLVVPEINAAALDDHQGIIACPNCTTIGVVMALEPVRQAAGLRSVTITTLQAVSGAGKEGIDELEAQLHAEPGTTPKAEVFAAPIGYNAVALCGNLLDNGYSDEEMKLQDESRKILDQPELGVSVTCVRVPVPVGHSASLLLETDEPLSPEKAREALSRFPGVRVFEDPAFPSPLDAVGGDDVLVGRVRKDLGTDKLCLWQVADNLRKGAATNAVQIAESLIERKLVECT